MKNRLHTITKITGSHTFYTGRETYFGSFNFLSLLHIQISTFSSFLYSTYCCVIWLIFGVGSWKGHHLKVHNLLFSTMYQKCTWNTYWRVHRYFFRLFSFDHSLTYITTHLFSSPIYHKLYKMYSCFSYSNPFYRSPCKLKK